MDRHVVLFATFRSDSPSYDVVPRPCKTGRSPRVAPVLSRRRALLLAAALWLCAPGAWAQGLACRRQKEMVIADLLFGRNIGAKLGVTERRWERFLAAEITPRFPDGLTVVNAAGQWRDQRKNRIVREPSKRVTIIMAAGAEMQEKIDAIVAAYKKRFRQQSVGVVVRPACGSF